MQNVTQPGSRVGVLSFAGSALPQVNIVKLRDTVLRAVPGRKGRKSLTKTKAWAEKRQQGLLLGGRKIPELAEETKEKSRATQCL